MRCSTPIRSAVLAAACVVFLCGPAIAQDGASFETAADRAKVDLERATRELAELREEIASKKLPLSRRLGEVEDELVETRRRYDEVSRTLDTRNLDLTTLRSEIESRKSERTYLSNLLDEYRRNLETRLHVTEQQRYRDLLERAASAGEDPELGAAGAFEVQASLVEASLDRLFDLSGGTRFPGTAVAEDGLVKPVTFAIVGPVALYLTDDGKDAGLAQQRLGSLEPNMVPLGPESGLVPEVRELVRSGQGRLPFDPSGGNALKIEETEDTLREHIAKGGPVMIPILGMAGIAILLAFLKWVQLLRIPVPSKKRVSRLLQSLAKGDFKTAHDQAQALKGPTGEMLRAGVEHIDEPRELIEEVMYEKTLDAKLRFNSFLPFIALTASAAPLLGLLGTVTGMINTFKLMTVFGTGDAKTLSSGISEALVTTQFGLIVAIPALLLYAYLSRRAKAMQDEMEKTAIGFVNRISVRRPSAAAGEAS